MIRKGIVIAAICLLGSSVLGQNRNYLLHTDANIAHLKDKIAHNELLRAEWEAQYERAGRLIESDRLRTGDCRLLGLAFRMTGEERFAEAIKKILLEALERPTWENAGLLSRTPPWIGGLSTAERGFEVAIGFDCAYTYLTKDERMQIAQGLLRQGINPLLNDWLLAGTSMHTFDTMGHNWWSVCVFMAGASSLAIRNEIPEAEGWAKEIAGYATEWFNFQGSVLQNKPPNFDKDGGFYESLNYANFALSRYLTFRSIFNNVLPDEKQPDLPILENLADFFINTTYFVEDGSPMSTNFGDGSIGSKGSGVVKQLWDLDYQEKRYAWYLNKFNQESSGTGERRGGSDLLLDPDLPEIKDNYLPDLPESHLYADMGWAIMRNSWEDNATMLAVKSGFTWNHAHADAGSYILFHKGKNLIIDGGNCSYGNPLYEKYYLQSESHNVVFFNGKGQNKTDLYYGVVNHGSLHNLIDGGDFKYLLANATGPYSPILDRNFRHFIWVGDVILVIDDLLAREPGQFEWLLHYNGESSCNGLDISIKEGDAEVLVRPLFPETFPVGAGLGDFPEKMKLEEKMGYKDHEPQTPQAYWSVSHLELTARTKFITAIILKTHENEEDLPVIKRFRGNDFLGVSITQNGKTTDVYLNLMADGRLKHRNSVIEMNGWKTDAYLTVLEFEEGEEKTKVGNIKNLFVGHGSYLRRDQQVLMHALSKYTGYIEDLNGNPKVIFQGQPHVTLRLHSQKKRTSMIVNDFEEKGSYDPSQSLLKLQLYE